MNELSKRLSVLLLFAASILLAADPLEVSCIINKANARITVLYTNAGEELVRVHMTSLEQVRAMCFYAAPVGDAKTEEDPILIRTSEISIKPVKKSTADKVHRNRPDRVVSLKKGESIGVTFPIWELAIYKDLVRVLLLRKAKGASDEAARAIAKSVRKLRVECFPICIIEQSPGKFVAVPSKDLKNVDGFELTRRGIEKIERIRLAEGADLPDHRITIPMPDPNEGDW